jgi:hypothetical protein
MLNNLLIETVFKRLKKLKINELTLLADETEKKTKSVLVTEIEDTIKTLSNKKIIKKMKKAKISFTIEVKHLLDDDINIDELIDLKVCLPLTKFFEKNPGLQQLFDCTCDLVNVNNTVKSNNCIPIEVQGLYILTIGKGSIDYIVKLGSFAESQGMHKRICSFGGGNYETGSLTNKWFQRFIKKAFNQGYTSKFTYYNRFQEKISVSNLDGTTVEMTPYVMRPLETELFKKYSATNHGIPPIFGSNCL